MNNKNILIVMIGIPASGKSTWAKEIKKDYDADCHVVSRDEIRFSMDGFSTERYFNQEKKVYDIYIKNIVESLHKNKITIADATHISLGSREKLFHYITKADKTLEYNVIYAYADTCEKECIERNSYRDIDKIVPNSVICDMDNNLKLPRHDNIKILRLSEWNKKYRNIKSTVGKEKLKNFINDFEYKEPIKRPITRERNL
jgi:predicted kinase